MLTGNPRRLSQQNYWRPGILLGILLSWLLSGSCNKASISFGSQFIDNSASNIVLVDTITPEFSTIHLDSVATAATGTVLVGTVADTAFGKISSTSYLSVTIPTIEGTSLDPTAKYDSVVMVMRPNKYYYGDTTQTQNLYVRQLTQRIDYPNNETSFYDHSSFPASTDILGESHVVISPNVTDSIRFRLSDNLGSDLFSKFISIDENLSTDNDFQYYFKGLQLSSGTTDKVMYGFKDSSTEIRVYYTESNIYPLKYPKYLSFSFTNNAHQFNQFTADRTGLKINNLSATNKQVFAKDLDSSAYVQTTTLLATKIGFPTLAGVVNLPDFIKLIKADLILRPRPGIYDGGLFQLPSQLELTATDVNNLTGGSAVTSSTGSSQYGSLSIDYLYGRDTYYTYDVTSYIQNLINNINTPNIIKNNGLLVVPPSPAFANSVNRVILDAFRYQNGNNRGAQLKLYYISVQQ